MFFTITVHHFFIFAGNHHLPDKNEEINFTQNNSDLRIRSHFTNDWKFILSESDTFFDPDIDDSGWRKLNLPHDWSIESEFSSEHPATPGGGALPGGMGWYRKTFHVPASDKNKLLFVEFDGIYQKGEVGINGHHLGMRPYGYSSVQYELTPHLNFGEDNVLAVKVDNSEQPNSRWYSGSGIYRNVWLVKTEKLFVDHWGTYVTTPYVTEQNATVAVETTIENRLSDSTYVKLVILFGRRWPAGGQTIARKPHSQRCNPFRYRMV